MTETEKLILEKLDELGQGLKEVNERTTRIEERTTRIELTVENEISKKIDIIGEGHDFLKQRLDEALQMEKKRESMELELINLRMEIKKIKEHLDIA
ncbi:hypothetical protein [Enterocloster bolteae]|uniref:Uncharacterized protein n=1 Tax=Enterocloster bolteae 90B8 TaxID=997897 RepID=R0B1E2_9FIRM|nr:hypothetical protein [Enterocloster bolteae]ENZ38097.1 hypothetical protein HMPREF1097_02679 [Enterocloster bolteae 90B8]RGO78049.1 hypothetical protein DXB04_27505 [Enterocloster bolteae]